MRPRFLFCLLALGLLLPAAAATPPAGGSKAASPPSARLRGADCLDPRMARGFVKLDERSLMVDAGRNHYRIEVAPSCWNLDFANVVSFRGDPISNRVCGSPMDAVLVRGNGPCRIEGMQLLDEAAYKQLQQEREAARRASRDAKRKKSGTP